MWFNKIPYITVFCITAGLIQAQQVLPAKPVHEPQKNERTQEHPSPSMSTVEEDTVYVEVQDGIPWNRDRFSPHHLVRKPFFDDALQVGYSYNLSFVGGSFGTFAQQSYMAHIAYEFTPNLHLYADLGLWMPLYSNLKFDIPREDVRQGRVGIVIPDIALEYKPSENTYMRLMFVNERDVLRAYGPLGYRGLYCDPYRNSIFCR